jgi:hypothetical protein
MSGHATWIQQEFGSNRINDVRLQDRLVIIAKSIFARPGALVSATQEDNANRKAAYKFFGNSKVNVTLIQEPHFNQTTKRCESEREVLIIQDTTYLCFGKRDALKEGYVGINQYNKIKGLVVHSALCINTQDLPLGLIYQKIYTHKPKKGKVNCENFPIEEKESYRWLEVIDDAVKQLGANKLIIIGDREADIFELLYKCEELGCKVIVRQCYDRKVCIGNNRLRISDILRERAKSFTTNIPVYNTDKGLYETRKFNIKYAPILIDVPYKKKGAFKAELRPVHYSVVQAEAIDEGKEIKWILLTNLDVTNKEMALKVLGYYKKRWHIENYHKALKSGFKAEDARLESYEALSKLVAILSVLAIRLYYILHLFKNSGEATSSLILERYEWLALCIKMNKVSPNAVLKPPTISEAVRMIAQLGGYMNRKNDGPPGIITLWRGWRRLAEIASFYKIILSTKLKGNR